MQLPRTHAFEFNDAEWTPPFVREMVVETLSRTLRWGRVLSNLVGPFDRFLRASGAHEVLDLCAGAAGPAAILASELRRAGAAPPRFLLTDLYPRIDAWKRARGEFPGSIDFVPEPVDATAISNDLGEGRARTMINALHHFSPDAAQAIFADAVRGSRGIFVAEAFGRNPARFLVPMAPAGLAALLANPLMAENDRLAKAALTWFSPIALGIGLWDGFVSALRMHTKEDLFRMVEPLGQTFQWEYGTFPYQPFGRGTYFFGVPRVE